MLKNAYLLQLLRNINNIFQNIARYSLPKFKKYDYSSIPFKFLLYDSKKVYKLYNLHPNTSIQKFTYYSHKSQ